MAHVDSATQHYLLKDDGEKFRLLNSELQDMLKRVVNSLGLVENTDKRGSKTRSKEKGSKTPLEFSTESKEFVVRITHVGGQQELYRHAVPASTLMMKYPGMCVATPEVFKSPNQSVLWREDLLLPGHKYILVPFKDVEKLKRKHPEHGNPRELNGVVSTDTLDTNSRSPSGHHTPQENGKSKDSNSISPSGRHHSPKENGKFKDSNSISPSGCHHSPKENGKFNDSNSRSPSGRQSHHHSPKENGKSKHSNSISPSGRHHSPKETGKFKDSNSRSPSGHHTHKENGKMKELNGAASQEMLEKRTALSPRKDVANTKMDEPLVEDSFICAKDFYVPQEKSHRPSRRRGIPAKKPFKPPLPRTRHYRGLGWQPSLPTVKELSP